MAEFEPRAAQTDLRKLTIDRGNEPRGRSPLALVLAFALGLGVGGAAVWFGAPRLGLLPSASSPSPSSPSVALSPESRASSPVATSTSTSTSTSTTPAGGEPVPILDASGYIIARREAEVGSKVPGRLAWMGVEAGSSVREGEIIARLEDTDVRAEIDLAKAALERSEKLVDRLKQSPTGTSANELDAALADLKVGRARLNLAESRLADTVIKAPFAGLVVEKRAEIGETVSPLATTGQLTPTGIARIVDFATLEAEVEVSERYVKKISEGQPASLVVTAFPGKRYRGELRQVIPTSSREKSVVDVRITFIDRDPAFLPGMATKVTFYERTPPP